ncbi:hypothetical protein BJV77DRAFT_968431 [Russula vinacea]|nr:hypothetical protein BJV77DRAFT_968431 [Russula vinacea]
MSTLVWVTTFVTGMWGRMFPYLFVLIPGILMIGTMPMFFNVPVTQQLETAWFHPFTPNEIWLWQIRGMNCNNGWLSRVLSMHYGSYKLLSDRCFEKYWQNSLYDNSRDNLRIN